MNRRRCEREPPCRLVERDRPLEECCSVCREAWSHRIPSAFVAERYCERCGETVVKGETILMDDRDGMLFMNPGTIEEYASHYRNSSACSGSAMLTRRKLKNSA